MEMWDRMLQYMYLSMESTILMASSVSFEIRKIGDNESDVGSKRTRNPRKVATTFVFVDAS